MSPTPTDINTIQAVNLALDDAMAADVNVIVLG
jgi:pyruvate dehydrogenase E1 component beta subunit